MRLCNLDKYTMYKKRIYISQEYGYFLEIKSFKHNTLTFVLFNGIGECYWLSFFSCECTLNVKGMHCYMCEH